MWNNRIIKKLGYAAWPFGMKRFDKLLGLSVWYQLLCCAFYASLVFALIVLINDAVMGKNIGAGSYKLFIHAINPDVNNHDVSGVVSGMLIMWGWLFITGFIITSLVSWVSIRREEWLKGNTRYSIKKNFILVIGGHKMVPALCKSLLTTHRHKRIVVQSRRIADTLRCEIEAVINKEDYDRVVIYCGDRTSKSDLDDLNAAYADEVYIIGEDSQIDNRDHDTYNLECFEILKNTIGTHHAGNAPVKCHVMFEYQATFCLFQNADIATGTKVDFRPFNFHEVWAHRVLSLCDGYYQPLDGGGITADSPKHVHLIVAGMSSMGVATAIEAAHLCHFPNFLKNPDSCHTRITFIDPEADVEMNFFKGRYANLFDICRWRYCDSAADKWEVTAFINPMDAAGAIYESSRLGNNLMDVEWEFIKGDIASPAVRKYLVEAANCDNALVTVAVCNAETNKAMSAAMYLPAEVYNSNNVLQVLVEQSERSTMVNAITTGYKFGIKEVKNNVEQNVEYTYNSRYEKLKAFGMKSECDYMRFVSEPSFCCVAHLYAKGIEATADIVADADYKGKLKKFWDEEVRSGAKTKLSQMHSNIYNANMVPVKARSFGINADVAPLCDSDVIEDMAQVEHIRWMMEQLLLGYRPTTAKEDAEIAEDPKAKNRYKNMQRAHVDIRAFELLTKWSTDFDREMSRGLPLLLYIMENSDRNE